MVEIKKLIERDSQGTPRQVFPETHIEAILGLKEQLNDTEVDNGTLAAILADANKFRTDIDTLDAVKAEKSDLEKANKNIDTLDTTKADKTALALTDSKVADLDSVKADKAAVLADSNKFRTDINLLDTNKVDKGGNEQVTLGMLSQPVKEAITGGSLAVVGKDAVNTTNVVDSAITAAKLSNSFGYRGVINSGESVNTLAIKQGTYLIMNGALDIPDGIAQSTHLVNEVINDRWYYQTIVNYSTTAVTKIWVRRFDKNNTTNREWTLVYDNAAPKSRTVTQVVTAEKSLNNDIDNGDYLLTSATGRPTNSNVIGHLSNFKGSPSLGYQQYIDRDGKFFYRFLDQIKTPNLIDIPFKRVLTQDDIPDISKEKPLSGNTVVNFGDSLIGNKRPPEDMSTTIANITGATVHNCGFGGCRMSTGKLAWEAFSMIRLAEAITSGDWSMQDEAIDNLTENGFPSYFTQTHALIKSIDFNAVDYITIKYGTNDFNSSVFIDDENDKYNIATVGGALRKSLELLWGKYPRLRVLIQAPSYRFWVDENYTFIDDSDTHQTTRGQVLPDYVAKIKEIATDYKTPFQDDYHNLGFNRYNIDAYFTYATNGDGTHPNVAGTKIMGEKTAYSLINLV